MQPVFRSVNRRNIRYFYSLTTIDRSNFTLFIDKENHIRHCLYKTAPDRQFCIASCCNIMEPSAEDPINELAFYTLARQDASFIHQHVVDAHTAQTADSKTKPIAIVFALVGLYLYTELHYSGKQVQQMHLKMARNKAAGWPAIVLPENRGDITVTDVLAAPPGDKRDDMIKLWCVAVWAAYQGNRETIINLSTTHLC